MAEIFRRILALGASPSSALLAASAGGAWAVFFSLLALIRSWDLWQAGGVKKRDSPPSPCPAHI